MPRNVALSLFLVHLIQHERGLFRLFERMRYDMPRFIEAQGYQELAVSLSAILRPDWQAVIDEYGLDEELIALTHCPYCLSLYTTILALILPKWARNGLMAWMGCYIVLMIKERLNDRPQTPSPH